jgi:exodeoxyribonuclease V alpha subunit
MRRLVEAVPAHARLILLGDPDQLPSVDAGCVLADLVESKRLAPMRAAFSRTFRFDHVPEIKRAAGALKSQAGEPGDDEARVGEALEVLTGGAGAVEWLQTAADWGGHLDAAGLAALARPYRERYLPALHRLPAEPDEAALRGVLAVFDAYRVLTLLRRGPAGVEALNEALATQLGFSTTGKLEPGRPVLVTENSYDLDLFNGDVGIVLSIAGTLKAVFPTGRTGVRAVAIERLPRHEPALAMTVHKAQGSQFGRVALVLSGRPTPVATREVVYTALTRAKDSFLWVGTSGELRAALGRRLLRWSALADRLDAGA